MENIILMSNSDREIISKNLMKYVSENYDLSKFINMYRSMFNSVTGNR